MKNNQITLEDLTNFVDKQRILFASDTKKNKQFFITLFNDFFIKKDDKIVLYTYDKLEAINFYNNL